MKNQITLDFCVWLQRNFDEILVEGPEWHNSLELKWYKNVQPTLVAATSGESATFLQQRAALFQQQAEEWDTFAKLALQSLGEKGK